MTNIVQIRPPSALNHSKNDSIGTSATQLTASATACQAVILTAHPDNDDYVWIGGSGVASGNGTPLNAGDSMTLWLDDVSLIYAIADSGTQKIAWVYV